MSQHPRASLSVADMPVASHHYPAREELAERGLLSHFWGKTRALGSKQADLGVIFGFQR